MRTALLLLLLAACDPGGTAGSETSTGAATTSAQAGGGEGGEAGDGGSTSALTASVASTSTASAGGSDEGGGGAAATSTASSSASVGSGGAGGGEPGCPAAPCPEFGLVCDPAACGGQWPSCDPYVCTDDPELTAHMFGDGLTIIRTPPIDAQHPRCAEVCDDPTIKWAMRLRVLGDAQCFRFRGPEGFSWQFANAVGDVPPIACGGTSFAGCDRGETSARYIVVSYRGESTPGAELSVDISDGDPCFLDEPDPVCDDVGCNGAGG